MKVTIKLCKHCPLKDDCSYKSDLFSKTRAILPSVTMMHNCPEYKNVFKERDEVEVQLLRPIEVKGNVKWVEDVIARGVVYYTPFSNTQKHFGVAFFEEQNFYHAEWRNASDESAGFPYMIPACEKKQTFGFKANQLKKIGEYTGHAFWGVPVDPTY
jgi:hypothetical protein